MIENIVIVGGGTAGWMAALAFASRFPKMSITVVDPKGIAPIGVGESVTGVVMSYVTDPIHRLSMGEFFRRCDVTFKAGIWYENWQGVGTNYLTPIDNPPDYFAHSYATSTEDFFASAAADGVKLGDAQLYARLMKARRTDHFRNPDGSVNVEFGRASCHFDSLKFAAWIQEKAVLYPNIHHIDDIIDSFEQNPDDGSLTKIRTRTGREIEGELFFDCTGFHRQLLAKAYRPKWIDYSDVIRVDSAIPFFQPFPEGEEIPSYTKATAMKNGWMWQIPTQSRFGRGYLFSSRYTDVPSVIAELRSIGLEPGDNPRVIRFISGRFEKQWIKNVCSIGLSGGFIEPLESATIHGMYVQVQLLAELLLPYCTRESMPSLAEKYNHLIAHAYQDYLDFISFHYHAGRDDTEFWRDCQRPTSMTEANRARRESWGHAFPTREDFAAIETLRVAHLTSFVVWAPMLDALGYLQKAHAQEHLRLSRHGGQLRENLTRYMEIRNRITASALSHSEAIRYFCALP